MPGGGVVDFQDRVSAEELLRVPAAMGPVPPLFRESTFPPMSIENHDILRDIFNRSGSGCARVSTPGAGADYSLRLSIASIISWPSSAGWEAQTGPAYCHSRLWQSRGRLPRHIGRRSNSSGKRAGLGRRRQRSGSGNQRCGPAYRRGNIWPVIGVMKRENGEYPVPVLFGYERDSDSARRERRLLADGRATRQKRGRKFW